MQSVPFRPRARVLYVCVAVVLRQAFCLHARRVRVSMRDLERERERLCRRKRERLAWVSRLYSKSHPATGRNVEAG